MISVLDTAPGHLRKVLDFAETHSLPGDAKAALTFFASRLGLDDSNSVGI